MYVCSNFPFVHYQILLDLKWAMLQMEELGWESNVESFDLVNAMYHEYLLELVK
jgi:hypothetical protein